MIVRHCSILLILSVIEILFHLVVPHTTFEPGPHRSGHQDIPGAADFSALRNHLIVLIIFPDAQRRMAPHEAEGSALPRCRTSL
jgi:hypothetical protein